MLVEGDTISLVGEYDALIRKKNVDTALFDVKGKTILPGFNDAHIHVWKVGQLESFIIDLRGIESIAQLQLKVKVSADKLPPGTWITGRGFNEQVLSEQRMPNKDDLDAISILHPIYLIRTCAHIAVTNSVGLEMTNITNSTLAPTGGVIGKNEDGQLNGLFYETALGLITKHIPPPSHADYQHMILAGARMMMRCGYSLL